MGIKRKQHNAEFKARVAMAALSGEKTLAQLSAEFGVHPTMISNWKQELVMGLTRFGGHPEVSAQRCCQCQEHVHRIRRSFADKMVDLVRAGRNPEGSCPRV